MFVFPDGSHKTAIFSDHTLKTFSTSGFLLTSPVFPRIAMETYIRQRQLIMSPLITSHVIGENEPLTSVLNKVIAAKEVNHKGQGTKAALGQGTVGGDGEGSIQSKVPALSPSILIPNSLPWTLTFSDISH